MLSIDCPNVVVGNAYISKTNEITSFLSKLDETYKNLNSTMQITVKLDILEPSYFYNLEYAKLILSRGAVGWIGTTGSILENTNISSHADKYSVLVITIHNINCNNWNNLLDDKNISDAIKELENYRTQSPNGTFYSKVFNIVYGNGDLIETNQGLFLRDEYISNFNKAKEVMSGLQLKEFVAFNSNIRYENSEDYQFTEDNPLLIKKICANDSEYLASKLNPVFNQVVKQISLNILSIDLPKSTDVLLSLVKYIS